MILIQIAYSSYTPRRSYVTVRSHMATEEKSISGDRMLVSSLYSCSLPTETVSFWLWIFCRCLCHLIHWLSTGFQFWETNKLLVLFSVRWIWFYYCDYWWHYKVSFFFFFGAGNAMAELGRLLMYEASRDWLVSRYN